MGKHQATGAHKIHSYFSASGGVLTYYRDNASTQVAYGESDSGVDVKFYGDTASAYMLWDESADTLEGASSATLNWLGTVTVSGDATFSGLIDLTGSTINIGNAAADKVGFFGITATVQQSFVASGAASTMIESVVGQLINLGLMASA